MTAFYGNLRQEPTRFGNRADNNCRTQAAGDAPCQGGLAGLALQARQDHAEAAIIDAACVVRAESTAVKLRLR
jgi:hypothetical protein